MKKIIRLGMTVEAAMTLVGRIKRLFQSRRLPDRAQQKEAEKRAWKELNRGIAREESRLKAMISRRQSLLSGAARWKKTALNALKADKIELAREALKQEEKILREIRELAGNPESAMEDLHRLKGSLAELAGQGSPPAAALRGGANRPGTDAYRIRLKERIQGAEDLLQARRDLFHTAPPSEPEARLNELRREIQKGSSGGSS